MIALSLAAVGLAAIEERLVGHQLIEALVLALLLGVAVRNVVGSAVAAPLKAGADLAAKQILEVGVALLGASVFFPEIVRAGPSLVGVVVGGVAAGIAVSFVIGRSLGLSTTLAVLVAVGNSICGNSAIAAVAPVIGAQRKDVVSAIGLTAVIGVCLVLGLPLLIGPLGLGNYQYGVLAGMSVYAVPQVVAAAFPVSQLSGEVATLVKLTRVLLLGPVVLVMAVLFARRSAVGGMRLKTFVPWFVAAFLVLAAVRSLGWLPDGLAGGTREVSRLLTIVAMAGLGFGVDLSSVKQVGVRVGFAVVASLAFMVSFTVVAIRLLGL
jgi:uncharacterized integral membrane protein (TIGR00698 family)